MESNPEYRAFVRVANNRIGESIINPYRNEDIFKCYSNSENYLLNNSHRNKIISYVSNTHFYNMYSVHGFYKICELNINRLPLLFMRLDELAVNP